MWSVKRGYRRGESQRMHLILSTDVRKPPAYASIEASASRLVHDKGGDILLASDRLEPDLLPERQRFRRDFKDLALESDRHFRSRKRAHEPLIETKR